MTTSPPSSALPVRLAVGAGALLLVLVAGIVGLLIGPEARVDAGDTVVLAIELGVAAVVWAVVLVLAREPDAGNRAAVGSIVLGAAGALGVVVFWWGFPLVLGIGAVLLGRTGATRAERGAGRATSARVGLVLGVLAIVLWLAAYVFVQEW